MVEIPLPIAVAAVVVGLGLAFLGRKIIKILVFLGAGLAGAKLAFTLLEPRTDPPIPLVGALIAFLILGFLSLAIMKIVFGIMLGILGYVVAYTATSNQVLAILVGVIVFVVGLVLFKYYLSVATAFAGAALVFSGLQSMLQDTEMVQAVSLLIAVVVAIAGTYVQVRQLHS